MNPALGMATGVMWCALRFAIVVWLAVQVKASPAATLCYVFAALDVLVTVGISGRLIGLGDAGDMPIPRGARPEPVTMPPSHMKDCHHITTDPLADKYEPAFSIATHTVFTHEPWPGKKPMETCSASLCVVCAQLTAEHLAALVKR